MNPDSQQARQIMRYLLGELSEEERSRLEEEYFADPAFFQEVRARRNDLIDAYLRGELSPDERESFETFFMATPRRRERVEFARTLMKTVDQAPASESVTTARQAPIRWWKSFMISLIAYRRPIIALGVLMIIFIGAWLLISSQRERDSVEEARRTTQPQNQNSPQDDVETPADSPSETNQPEMARRPPATPQVPSPRPELKVATFALTTGLVRDGAEAKTLTIPRNADLVQLDLEVERDDYPSYRAALRTPEGAEIWSQQIKNQPTKRDHTVVLRLPASLFKNADYILSLSGLTAENRLVDVGKYYFRAQIR